MNLTRLNITLPESLVLKLNHMVGPRKKSKFIAEAILEKMEKIKEASLREQLEEGYKARREESLEIAEDFKYIDQEGWNED